MREASKVLVKFFKPLGAIAIATALCAPVWSQTAQTGSTPGQAQGGTTSGPQWKDRAEYDLYESITKETDASKRLGLLDQWKQKYPTSDFQKQRLQLYIPTYQQLGRAQEMFAAANELYKLDSNDLTAAYWLMILTPSMNVATDAAALDTAEKASNVVLQNLNTTFGADKKPATITADAWAKQRSDAEAAAHKTLGWVDMVRKNNDAAEKEFRESIRLNPAAGEVAYWLGNVLIAQKDTTKIPEALFYLARASSYTGPGALAEAGRKDIDAYLAKAYATYHGSANGLEDVKKVASANAMPPAGWTIKSSVQVAEEQQKAEQAAAEADPQGVLWKRIKTELTSDAGQAYFDQNMKDAKPPAKSFRGTVVTSTPKEITLAMSPDNPNAEATLKFETPVPKVEAGKTLEFTGTAKSYTRDPFMVTFDSEKSDVVGFPTAPAKRAPVRRGRRR